MERNIVPLDLCTQFVGLSNLLVVGERMRTCKVRSASSPRKKNTILLGWVYLVIKIYVEVFASTNNVSPAFGVIESASRTTDDCARTTTMQAKQLNAFFHPTCQVAQMERKHVDLAKQAPECWFSLKSKWLHAKIDGSSYLYSAQTPANCLFKESVCGQCGFLRSHSH